MPRKRRLPRAGRLQSVLKKQFAKQRQEVLAEVRRGKAWRQVKVLEWFEPGKHKAKWNREMTAASRPFIAVQYDEGLKETLTRLGRSDLTSVWNVSNPKVRDSISAATMKFSEATNETTSLQLGEAVARVRRELAEGILGDENTVDELTRRVQGVFDRAETGRARTIAITESSRAVHGAQRMVAVESGVVTGFQWLASSDACPLCQQLAADSRRGIGLNDHFASGPGDYDVIDGPPAHPNCMCTMTEVLGRPEREPAEEPVVAPEPITAPTPPAPRVPRRAPRAPKPSSGPEIFEEVRQAVEDELKSAGVLENSKWAVARFHDIPQGPAGIAKLREMGGAIKTTHTRILQEFPAVKTVTDKAPLRSLHLSNRKDLKSALGSNEYVGTGGLYKPEFDQVWVAKGRGGGWTHSAKPGVGMHNMDYTGPGIYTHELAHHVFRKCDYAAIKEFKEAFRKLTPKEVSRGISGYAAARDVSGAMKVSEGFAEAFCAYTHPSYEGYKKLHPAIDALMRKWFPRAAG